MNAETHNLAEYFDQRRIPVGRTPAQVLHRARGLVEQLEAGAPYWRLYGKRVAWDRRLISIPIGRKWRLLAVDQDGRIVPREVLSHARYNDLGGQRRA